MIVYNAQTENYSFYKITKKGDTIKTNKAYSYKGIPTKVIIEDLNTFYYDVRMNVESYDVKPINGDQGMEVLGDGFTKGVGAFNQLVDEVKDNDIYKSLFVDGKFQGIEGLKDAFGYAGTEVNKGLEYIGEQQEMLSSSQIQMKKISTKLQRNFESLLLTEFVNDQLVKIQMNDKISPDQMKLKADQLLGEVFVDELNLEAVIALSENSSNSLSNNHNEYRSIYNQYSGMHDGVIAYIQKLKESMDEDDAALEIVKGFENELLFDKKEIELNIETLALLTEEYDINKIRQDYLSVYENYEKIATADFNHEYSLSTDMDFTSLTMEFVENTEPGSEKSERVIKTRKIEVPVKGGLRINSSVGMSFLRFVNGHGTYQSIDGVVAEQSGDAVKPALNTMFHFYKQTPAPVMLGGGFGVGIPVEGDKELIYMLGGSLIFGKTERVIFNFGGFGGKIARLSGMKVGDPIQSGTIVPTAKIFDYGFYAGITFNIAQLF